MKRKDKKMNKMIQEYNTAMGHAKLMAFSQVIRRHDGASISSLADFACTVGAGDITVGDLINMPRTDAAWRRKLALPPAKKARKAIGGTVNTGTKDGSYKYRNLVLSEMVKNGGWMSSTDIQKVCGGSLDQVRSALSHLMYRADRVWRMGKGRSSKYRVRPS